MYGKRVLIIVDAELLQKIDEYLKEETFGGNRSAFFRVTARYFLDSPRGLRHAIKRRYNNEHKD
jgi:metal-responsive CopG/Arc/MetJ family transcriptional regulator